ncbi:amino acid transporter [Achromobacter pestifer]|uniref:Amino acid transporter n=1 Tax=Achromobacter pestifer TaxID=1353889 RepID=A0A7D4E246_9BURK|nr:LysE/ArgO family amino acid transporter [Achromobacter pestifer]QKH39648.1 amino acid transporter [Achromobacter pestifer]
MYSAFIFGFATSVGLILAIGPQNAFVLRQGLQKQHVGLVVATCAISDGAMILAGVAGAGHLVQQSPLIMQGLRFGGAAFLACYGVLAARRAWSAKSTLATSSFEERSWRHALLTALAFTFLNPHVYLDTIVLMGTISTGYAGMGKWIFALGASVGSVTWFSLLGFGARLLQPVFSRPISWKILDLFIAALMLSLSALLLLSAIS